MIGLVAAVITVLLSSATLRPLRAEQEGNPTANRDLETEVLKDLDAIEGARTAADAAPTQNAQPASEDAQPSAENLITSEDSLVLRATEPEVIAPAKPAAPPMPKAQAPRKAQYTALAPNSNEGTAITNLEFRMEGDASRILVSANGLLKYKESRNPGVKQYVYVFENTSCSQKLQRAYDTTEFSSPVAYFTLLEIPKRKQPQCKLIVQLREAKEPVATNTDRGLYLDFPASEQKVSAPIISSDSRQIASTGEGLYNGESSFGGKPIDLEVKGSDIQDVLRLIGRSSGYNIVIGDDVQGKLGTLSLQGIPWDQALALVLQMKKLGYVRQGNVLRVSTLTNIKTEREEAAAAELSQIKAEAIRTVLVPLSYAPAASLAPRAKPFLSERGTVDTDDRTNTLIIRDVDRVVNRVQKLISLLDIQPPRVTISARFVEMTRQFSNQVGITRRAEGGGGMSFSAAVAGISLDPAVSGAVEGSPFSTAIRANNFANLQAILALGEQEEEAKTLSNPTITITSNQRGTVTSGQSVTITTVNAQGSATTTITANLSLSITPSVSSDGSISMNVNLTNDVLTPGTTPTVQNRNIATNILIQDGDTAVIGGVYKEENTDASEGVPFLRQIPIVGALFGGRTSRHTRGEIMIFLTAKITNPEETFKKPI
jgi:type IV pilus assembly protein PilQ